MPRVCHANALVKQASDWQTRFEPYSNRCRADASVLQR
jgi:hypothetical protein